MTTHSDRERIAARWLIEQDDPDFSDEQREELARWLLQSMENCTTYLKLVRAWRRTVLLRRNEAPLVYRKRRVAGAADTKRASRAATPTPRERGVLDRRFGDVLRQYRQTRGLSQAKLAALSGVHYSFISRIESGTRKLDVTTMYVLARALDVAPSRLMAQLGRVVAGEKVGGERGRG